MNKESNSIESLRGVVRSSLEKQLYTTALFFADKVLCMSRAYCYFQKKEYKRAKYLLLQGTNNKLIQRHLPSMYLAAQSAAQLNDWEECLEILGDATDTTRTTTDSSGSALDKRSIDILAAICLLRGKAYTALENRPKAAQWLKESITRDVHCYEAFEHLIDHNMLTASEADSLLSSLAFPEESQWLKEFYICKLKKYDSHEDKAHSVGHRLNELEAKYSLQSNLDVAVVRAEMYFYQNKFQQCFEVTKRVLAQDPYHSAVMVVHLSCLVELKMTNELFYCGHKLVDENPSSPVAWYGVGCYYYLIGNFENARRKANSIDNHFGPSWLGFGHSFAAQGEHDQAMASYRTACRILSGYHCNLHLTYFSCHLASLCIGMELIRVNNLNLAEQYLTEAKQICSDDPLIYNEFGVIYYKNQNYQKAVTFFLKALQMCDKSAHEETWESTIVNLAHSFRKICQYSEALHYYLLALSVSPNNASTYTAIAFTHQLQGNLFEAVDNYHKCLALKPEDSFATEMLSQCLNLIVY